MSSSAIFDILEIEIAALTFYVDLLQRYNGDRLHDLLYFAQASHQERVLDIRESLSKEGFRDIGAEPNYTFVPKLSVEKYLSEKRLIESLRLAEQNIFDAYHEYSARVATKRAQNFAYEHVLDKQQNLCLELEAYSSAVRGN